MTTSEIDRDKALRQAYGKATADLREQFKAEFEALYKSRAAEAGIDWSPRKTAEERAAEKAAEAKAKAKAKMDALLAQFPDLIESEPSPADAPEEQQEAVVREFRTAGGAEVQS